MFIKIIAAFAFLTCALAQHGHHATSYSSVNSLGSQVSHDGQHYHHDIRPTLLTPIVSHAAPVLLKSSYQQQVEHYAHPKYQFNYGVHDGHTLDVKNQEESRDGDIVKGTYSLLQPDGRTRVVHYSSDKHNGFHAHVEYSGHAAHPEVLQKTLISAPIYHH